MANSFEVITMITNESMRLAHEKATFLSTIDRQYDDSYAKSGAKIGSALRVRKPNQYEVTTASRVMDAQDQAEGYETVTMASQYHVDMHFDSNPITAAATASSSSPPAIVGSPTVRRPNCSSPASPTTKMPMPLEISA